MKCLTTHTHTYHLLLLCCIFLWIGATGVQWCSWSMQWWRDLQSSPWRLEDIMCQFERKEGKDVWCSVHGSWEYAASEHFGQQDLAVLEGQEQDTQDKVRQAVSGLAARSVSKDWYGTDQPYWVTIYFLTPPTYILYYFFYILSHGGSKQCVRVGNRIIWKSERRSISSLRVDVYS